MFQADWDTRLKQSSASILSKTQDPGFVAAGQEMMPLPLLYHKDWTRH